MFSVKDIILLLNFLQAFKNINTLPNVWAVENRQGSPMSFSLPSSESYPRISGFSSLSEITYISVSKDATSGKSL